MPRLIPLKEDDRSTATMRWLEQALGKSKLPALIVWGREEIVFPADCAERFKKLLPHAQGPYWVTGSHFLQAPGGATVYFTVTANGATTLPTLRAEADGATRSRGSAVPVGGQALTLATTAQPGGDLNNFLGALIAVFISDGGPGQSAGWLIGNLRVTNDGPSP